MKSKAEFIAVNNMLYPEIFKSLECVRWNMADDVPWDQYRADQLSNEQALTIKMNAITTRDGKQKWSPAFCAICRCCSTAPSVPCRT